MLVEHAVAARGVRPATLTLGSDNGSAFTARAFKLALSGLGVAHRRGGYRDPESQAFIESWFGKLKECCVWLHEFETSTRAREVIGAHIDGYHQRPHSGLNYKTPAPGRPNLGRRPRQQPTRPKLPTTAGADHRAAIANIPSRRPQGRVIRFG